MNIYNFLFPPCPMCLIAFHIHLNVHGTYTLSVGLSGLLPLHSFGCHPSPFVSWLFGSFGLFVRRLTQKLQNGFPHNLVEG